MEYNNCVGIDIGYGYTKIHSNGQNLMFPTSVAEFNLGDEAMFSGLVRVRVNGKDYIVGQQAEREGSLVRTRTTGFVASSPWLAVLSHSLNRIGFRDGNLVLGVPPKDFTNAYRRLILDSLRSSEILSDGVTNPHKFNGNVQIIPQGAGIYFKYARENPIDYHKNILIVDVGHFTVDFTYFSGGKYVESAAESEEMGMSKLLDNICDRFYQVNNRMRIGHREALLLLQQNEFTSMGKTYSLPQKAALVQSYGGHLGDMIDEHLRKLSLRPDIGIIGGGGGRLLRDVLQAEYAFRLIEDPELANAIGYWIFGMQL